MKGKSEMKKKLVPSIASGCWRMLGEWIVFNYEFLVYLKIFSKDFSFKTIILKLVFFFKIIK